MGWVNFPPFVLMKVEILPPELCANSWTSRTRAASKAELGQGVERCLRVIEIGSTKK